jgi:hypothetical protein
MEDIRSDADNINLMFTTNNFYLSKKNHIMLNNVQVIAKDTKLGVQEINVKLEQLQSKQQVELAQDELEKIVSWLTPLKFDAKQQRLIEGCFQPSTRWFLETEEFIEWSKGGTFQLRLFGDAGSGKVS